MHSQGFPYSENLLQWVWENLLFDIGELVTEKDSSVKIHNPGSLNHTDGPDFSHAIIEIDGMIWHGSVEIHLRSSGWEQHGHHLDENYNQVILHVVAEQSPKNVILENGGSPHTLNLLPYLPEELKQFITHFRSSSHLPCVNGLHYISPEAFRMQIQKAHREYFEKKVNDLMAFYSPDQLPTKAWKDALVISIFDAFGIAYNRKPMQEMGRWFLLQEVEDEVRLIDRAFCVAGFTGSESVFSWNYKGVRPNNHPRRRVEQAIKLSLKILKMPMETFFEESPDFFFESISKKAGVNHLNRTQIIYGTVFLPAIYLLGTLFGSKKISEQAHRLWESLHTPIPKGLLKKIEGINGIDREDYAAKLGSIHQLKAYCSSGRCTECFVLKKAILS